jgi:hypothetical protein
MTRLMEINWLKLPSSEGSILVKRLLLRSIRRKLLKSPISIGTGPESEFFDKSKLINRLSTKYAVGNLPLSLLLERSQIIT